MVQNRRCANNNQQMDISTSKKKAQESPVTPTEAGQMPHSAELPFRPSRRRQKKLAYLITTATIAALAAVLLSQLALSPLLRPYHTQKLAETTLQRPPRQQAGLFGGLLVAAQGDDETGGADEFCDEGDPICADYEPWVEGQENIELALVDFITDNSYYGFYNTLESGLTTTHLCNQLSNFSNILEWLYECVYNGTGFRTGTTEELNESIGPYYNSYDDDICEDNGANCYRDASNSDLWDPCIEYYENERVCARCKYGMVRIFSESSIFCGTLTSTTTQVCDEESTYDEYGDCITFCDDCDYIQEVSCEYASAPYSSVGIKLPNLSGFVPHHYFRNATTNIAEPICMEREPILAIEGCFVNDLYDQDAESADDWYGTLDTQEERDLVQSTGGCFQCDTGNGYQPIVTYTSNTGFYEMTCVEIDNSEDPVENQVCGNGQIYQWVGVIESVQELVCSSCSDLIPNCLMCDSGTNCNLCKGGYLRASIKDSSGVDNIICLPNFCGFYGQGDGCSDNVALEGCDKSSIITSGRFSQESCERCSPGYYEVAQEGDQYSIFTNEDSGTYVYFCYPVRDKLKRSHFLAPFDSVLADDKLDPYADGADDGLTVDNPAYSLQQILRNYQGDEVFYSPVRGFSEVTIEIYLFKGAHHYVNCIYDDWMPDSLPYNKNDVDFDKYSWICGPPDTIQYATEYMAKVPTTDNIKFFIRALDCDYLNNIFNNESDDTKEIMREKCLDVDKGEKSQIRISSPHTYFNITNFARFENIEFTGEDLFAKSTYDGSEMDFGGDQGILGYMPFKKCSIQQDPAKLDTLDELTLKVENVVDLDKFEYTCGDGFSRADYMPPYEFDDRCFTPEYVVYPNTTACSGNPRESATFWAYETTQNGYFPLRHKVLFNLYSFDPLRTRNVKPPSLELVGCRFKYFVNFHDSLINVETNNFGYIGDLDEDTDTYELVTFYGEDRSARISIEDSQFYSNSFCKGMIYYSRFQEITYEEAPKLLNYTANFLGQAEVFYEELSQNYIKIKSSEFVNTGFHQVIQALQMDDGVYKVSDELYNDVSEVSWKTFQDLGLIINTDGFGGTIEILDSTFKRNMAYIQQILLYESQETKSFSDLDDKEMLQDFTDENSEYLQLKICVDTLWTSRYFLNDVVHPDKEWDDDLFVQTFENVAPFVIKGNQGPIIFNNNNFRDNIGTTGGVLHIEDPDFRYATEDEDKNPYIVLKDNKFLNNMAYWAGNAFHISLTMRMIYGSDLQNNQKSDAWQTCGAGILFDNNFFEGNIGLKKHNGGAGVIRCRHSISKVEDRFNYLSGKQRDYTIEQVTDRLGNVLEEKIGEMDDPSTTMVEIKNLYGSSDETYKLLKYGTKFVNNTFANNYSGKRGSALLLENLSEVQLIENRFTSNGPVHAHMEIENSPYYKHFLKNNRTLAYFVLDSSQGYCFDEAMWLNVCYRSGYVIDMPQIQGALYVKNCYSEATCWSSQDESLEINNIESYEDFRRQFKPWQRLEITRNLFYDNHANIVMFPSQVQPQASSIFIFGGTENILKDNEFTGHRGWASAYMMNEAWDIFRYYPVNYFRYSSATMIRVEYPYSVYAETIAESVEQGVKAIETTMIANSITDNYNMQVLSFKDLRYQASLLEYDCDVSSATLTIRENVISRNQFIGEDTTFFYINGGIVEVSQNEISYNGMLTAEVEENSADKVDQQYQRAEFPWDDYSFTQAQDKGIFSFNFEYSEMPAFKAHNFTDNRFTHIYCQTGCAYYVTGSKIQQFSFRNNVYNILVSSVGSAVFHGEVNLQPSNELAKVWIQSYRDETFDRIWGGSIRLTGNNVPATIIKNSTFINNFGSTGAAISFNRGGALYIRDSEFRLDYSDDEVREALRDDSGLTLSELEPFIERLYGQLMYDISLTYKNQLPQKFLFSKDIFNKQIKRITNDLGQIYLKTSFKTILNDQQPVFAFDNTKLKDVILSEFDFEILETLPSAIKDSYFKYNVGVGASAILSEGSYLKLIGTNDEVNFINNVTPQGSTIYGTFSYLESNDMIFKQNIGYQGGAYQLDSQTQLFDTHSVYEKNKATQGGVVFAINDSEFVFTNSDFLSNNGYDGAVLYGMYNSFTRALSFIDCRFMNNYSQQNLMQLMSSKAFVQSSVFENNYAKFVNHGITMITSEIEFFNSTVSFSEGFADNLDLTKLDCGFFSLFLSSKIVIGKNTEIRNLVALNQAVMSAFSLSSVYVTEDVRFLNNRANSPAGMTISLQNTDVVIINDAYFSSNPQTNVQIELGKMQINNSTFTKAGGLIVYGIDSVVQMANVNMHNSSSVQYDGHGFYCTRCFQVTVEDSTFENLESKSGGAIYIESLFNETALPVSYIRNSSFLGNRATTGGAMILDRPYMIQLEANKFFNNTAYKDAGGGILYRCNPTQIDYECTVSLIGNEFGDNFSKSQGGAVRYVNTNFTVEPLTEESKSLTGRLLQSSKNLFYDTNEAIYGPNLGSYHASIDYIVPPNESGAFMNMEDKTILLAAGQAFELVLQIIDKEGRLYNAENTAIAKISFVSGQELGSQALMLGSDAVAEDGELKFNSFKVRIKPKTSAKIQISFQGLPSFGTPIDFIDVNPVFTVIARECVQGEQYTEDLSCKPCPAQFFLYEAQTSPGLCRDCHPHAYCYGMNNTAPKPGYWRSQATLEEYSPCFRPESCLGGNQTDPIGQCETGYQGILCNDCAPQYSRSGLECSLCPAVFWNVAIFALLLLSLIAVIMLLVKSTLGGVEMRKPLYQVYLKIFLNHFQILAAVASIDFKWPPLIQSVLQSQQGIADGPSRILSVDCIMMDMFPGSEPSFRLNYIRLIMFTSLPFIIAFFSMVFWQIYGACKRIHAKERSDKATATTIIVLFLFYPTIVAILAKSLNCITIEDNARLYDDLEEKCYEGMHLAIVLFVSVPGLIAWAAGIPIYALIKLFKNVGHLEKIKKFTAGKQHEDLLRSFRVRLGFLTAGYDDKYFYWEIVLLMRKTVLVLMIVFLSAVSPGVQSLTAILVLTIFFMIQWRLEPYYDEGLNRMETLSLFVIILTIYFGLYYQAGQGDEFMESSAVTWFIFLAVLIPSVTFAVNFSKIMWIEILKVVAGKSAKAFRYLTCGSWDLQQFKAIHMDYGSDDDNSEEEEDENKKPPPNDEQLVGFKQKEEGYSSVLKNKIIERRKKIYEQKAIEQLQADMDKPQDDEKKQVDKFKPIKKKVDEVRPGTKERRKSKMHNSIMRALSESNNTPGKEESFQSESMSSSQSSQVSERSTDKTAPQQQNYLEKDTDMKKHKQGQNFQYKDEIQFPGEKPQRADDDFDDPFHGEDSSQKVDIKSILKREGTKEMIQPNDSALMSSSLQGIQLDAILEKDSSALQSRNDQEQFKKGNKKAVGVTDMMSKAPPQKVPTLKIDKPIPQIWADQVAKKPRMLFKNKREVNGSEASGSTPHRQSNGPREETDIVDDDDRDVKGKESNARNFHSGKTYLNMGKNQPQKSRRAFESEEDDDFKSDEEEGGIGKVSIRGNTERKKDPKRGKDGNVNAKIEPKTLKSKRGDGSNRSKRGNSSNRSKRGASSNIQAKVAVKVEWDDECEIDDDEDEAARGREANSKGFHSGATYMLDRKPNDVAPMAAKSSIDSMEDMVSGLGSDEEGGGKGMITIRGNTERKKKTERSEIHADFLSDEEGGGIGTASIRGNTQRKKVEVNEGISKDKKGQVKSSHAAAAKELNDEGRENIFYKLSKLEQEENKVSSGKQEDQEASKVVDQAASAQKKRKKRNRNKKKNNGDGEAGSQLGGGGGGLSQRTAGNKNGAANKNMLSQQLSIINERQKKRDAKGNDQSSSDSEYLF